MPEMMKSERIERDGIRFSIRAKLLTAFLGLSVISLVVFGYIGMRNLRRMGEDALAGSTSLGTAAAEDSTRALENLGRQMIEQKARDVARQMETYIAAHPGKTLAELKSDPTLADIAVQPVGESGYTSVLDSEGINIFHSNPRIIGSDMDDLKEKLPDFYALIQKMKKPEPGGGYYRWEDADRVTRDKYLYHVRVAGTNWKVGATTYIDEFLRPVEKTRREIAAATAAAARKVDRGLAATRRVILISFLLLVIIVVILSFSLSLRITRPILLLSRGAKILGQGELDHRVEVKTGDELEELGRSFNTMASDLQTYTVELRRTTAEKERLEKELEIAHGIQQSFLPETVPDLKGMEIAASNLSAKEVGGDFYDFIPVGKDEWGLVIADVSGKGVPAALFMAVSRTLVRATTTESSSPSEAIRRANDLILVDARSSMFVTLFYAILDSARRTLRYVNAGHNPPLLIRDSPGDLVLLKAKGIALGVLEDITLQEEEIKLETGDLVVLFTDGVTEAINAAKEQFGQERLFEVVHRNRDLAAREIIRKVQDEVKAFAGAQPQFDDITLMVLRVLEE